MFISIIDVSTLQELLLEPLHAVCNDDIEYGNSLGLVLLCRYRLHDLKYLVLLLERLRRLMTTLPLQEILHALEIEVIGKVQWVLPLVIFQADLSAGLSIVVKEKFQGIIVIKFDCEMHGG